MTTGPTKEELIYNLDMILFGWAFKDVERAAIHGESKLGGFILGACFIDAMAGFYEGIDKESAKRDSGKRFMNFVEKYLKRYDPVKLWEDLRCGLVHSYAEGGSYVFTDNNRTGFHFDRVPSGKIILNLEDFCADLRTAYCSFRQDILTDDALFARAKYRFSSMGLMGPMPKHLA
jgi:hypothetical protein